jgi:AcrR family transcriptional regulator
MSRERDEGKKLAILGAAKKLFAARGYLGTSVSDLAREIDLPVGSIYTYFENKEALLRTVIEEGWEEFLDSLGRAISGPGLPEERLALVIYRFLPELFGDIDLISIILAEADRGSRLDEKLERLASLLSGLIAELAEARGVNMDFPPRRAMAAITIYFLGSLDALRISRSAGISLSPEDLIDFIKLSVESSFGVTLLPPKVG